MKIIASFNDFFNPLLYTIKRGRVVIFKELVCFLCLVFWTYTGAPMPPQAAKAIFFDYRNYLLPYEIQKVSYLPLNFQYVKENAPAAFLNFVARFTPGSLDHRGGINSGSVYEVDTIYESYYSLKQICKEPATIKEFLTQKAKNVLNALDLRTITLWSLARNFITFMFFVILIEFLWTVYQPYCYDPSQVNLQALKDNLNAGALEVQKLSYVPNMQYFQDLDRMAQYTVKYLSDNFSQRYTADAGFEWILKPDSKLPTEPILLYCTPVTRMFSPTENSVVKTSRSHLTQVFLQDFLKRSSVYFLVFLATYAGRYVLKQWYLGFTSRGYDNLLTVILYYLSVETVYTSFMSLLLLGPTLVYDPSLLITALTGIAPYRYVFPQNTQGSIFGNMPHLQKIKTGFLLNHTVFGWILLFLSLPVFTQGFLIVRPLLLLDTLTRPETLEHNIAYGLGRGGGLFDASNWVHLAATWHQGIIPFIINFIILLVGATVLFEVLLYPLLFLSSSVKTFRAFLRLSWLSDTGSSSLIKNIFWLFDHPNLQKKYRLWSERNELLNVSQAFVNGTTLTEKTLLVENFSGDRSDLFNTIGAFLGPSNLAFVRLLGEKQQLEHLRTVDTDLGKVKPLRSTYLHEVLTLTRLQRLEAISVMLFLSASEILVKLALLVVRYVWEVCGPLKLMSAEFNFRNHLSYDTQYLFTYGRSGLNNLT